MTYTEKHFERCAFNPMCKNPMVDEFQKLRTIFTTSDDAVIRYTIMMYDPASFLVRDERDWNKRRDIACELTFVDSDAPELQETIYEAFIDYLQYINDKVWAAASAAEMRFWEAIKLTLIPITETGAKGQLEAAQKKAVLAESIDDCIKRIETYAKDLSGGDVVLEKRIKKSFVSPEQMLKNKNV